jgi:dTDP-4-amino-4,6-dideoxygalactose transaminase
MPVPLFDLSRKNAQVQAPVEEAVLRVLRSGRFVLGEEVERFERASAEAAGSRFALGVSSGTDALMLALMALGVGPGDEVLTTPFTFASSVSAPVRLGARPVFADINPETFNLDPGAVVRAVTGKTKVLLPVHLYGLCTDLAGLAEAAPGVPVLEDAAQAQGSRIGDKGAGAIGTAGCLSFYPTKNLGAYGDAGMVLTSDEDLLDRLRLLRVHGDTGGYYYEAVGANFRLDPLQAAALAVKLPLVEEWIGEKRRAAQVYAGLFADAGLVPEEVTIPLEPEGYTHTYALYVIRARDRDGLMEHLRGAGIGANIYYPVPMHLQPAFRNLGYGEGDFPHAEKACGEVLSIPMFAGITEAEIAEVVGAVKTFYRG